MIGKIDIPMRARFRGVPSIKIHNEKGIETMEEKVLEILEEYCEEALTYEGDNMMEEGIIDSFTVINIVSELEDAFDIEIDAKYVVAENFKNKAAILELVERLLEEA